MSGYNENSDNQSDSDQTATGWIAKNPTTAALGGIAGVRAGSALAKYLYAAARAGISGVGRLAGGAMSPSTIIPSMALGGAYQLATNPKQSLYNTLVPHSIVPQPAAPPAATAPAPTHVDMLGNPETAVAPGPGALSTRQTVPDVLAPVLSSQNTAVPLPQPRPQMGASAPQIGAPLNIAPQGGMSNFQGVPLAGLTPPGTNFGAPQAANSQTLLQKFAQLLSNNADAATRYYPGDVSNTTS